MKQNQPLSFIIDNSLCMAVYWLCAGSILAKFTETIGLSVAVSNMVVALPSTLLAFQVLGAFVYTRLKAKHKFLIITNITWRLLVPLVFFTVLLPKNIGSIMMVIGYIIMVSVFHICSPNYATWMVNSVAGKVKSNFFSIRETAFMVVYTSMMFLYGMITDAGVKNGDPAKAFTIIAVIQLCLILASLIFLIKYLPKPKEDAAETEAESTTAPQALSIKEMIKKTFEIKPFVRLVLLNVVWSFASIFVGNFASLYQVQILKIDFGEVILWGTIANIARAVATPLFGKIADKIGWKTTTLIGFLPYILTGILWIFATKENIWIVLPVATICSSIMNAGFGVGLFKYQISNSRPETRSLSFSVFAAAGGISALIASVTCSGILAVFEAMPVAPFWVVFLIGVILCLVVAVILRTIPYKEAEE